MLTFRNVDGEEFNAVAEVSRTKGVNGEKSLSGTVISGDAVIHNLDKGWSLTFNHERYVVTYANPKNRGQKIELEFDAVHEFFWDFGKKSSYGTLDGSNVAAVYLDFIFANSGYDYVLEPLIHAFEKQNFGNDLKINLFQDFISQTNLEFEVIGKKVIITDTVGSDLSTVVRKRFNMQDLQLQKNIDSFVTYQKGFGAWHDEEDHSKGRLEVTYRSPLADIYGELHAQPVVDERYTVADSLLEKIKNNVDNSYNISVNLTMEDLTSAGYQVASPQEGDWIMAIDEDLGFEQKVRIVSYTTNYDINGRVTGHDITCSNLNATDSIAKKQTAEVELEKELQMYYLDKIRNDIIESYFNEDGYNYEFKAGNKYGLPGGYYSFDAPIDQNPSKAIYMGAGKLLIANSKTTDGLWEWRTAATGDGFTADVVNTGTLNGILIQSGNNPVNNFWNLDTGELRVGSASKYMTWNPTNNLLEFNYPNTGTRIHEGGIITTALDKSQTYIQNGIVGTRNPGGATIGQFGYRDFRDSPVYVLSTSWGSHFKLIQKIDETTEREVLTLLAGGQSARVNLDEAGRLYLEGGARHLDFETGGAKNHGISGTNVSRLNITGAESVGLRANDSTIAAFSNNGVENFISFYATPSVISDGRLKKNINPTKVDALTEIRKLNFVEYDWIKNNLHEDIGLIAQDAGMLTMYSPSDDDYGINSTKQQMLNSKAIQQLENKNEKLRIEVAELNNELSELKELLKEKGVI